MKIGILTFWWSEDNYGQQLQAYALQRYLRDAGHDAFLIRYNYENDLGRTNFFVRILKALNPIILFKFFVQKKRIADSKKENELHSRHFCEFRKNYFKFSDKAYSNFEELKSNPPEADAYIVGSDQVWNFGKGNLRIFKNVIHSYFLDFGKSETKRISYAASWGGRNNFLGNEKSEIQKLLKNFDFISVREKNGINLCKQIGRNDAKWVCDPTLLLNAEIYRTIYKEEKIQTPSKPYILFYYLENGGRFDKKAVWNFAKEKNLEVQYVTGNACIDNLDKKFATVPEWLCLVDNAEYIVTNSFHCCVFSILFEKKFAAIKLDGLNCGMNSRLESLFEMTGCGERYITDTDFKILDKSYSVDKDFTLKKESERFLKLALIDNNHK